MLISQDHREPIFIVGAPRSGTTLLAAVLGAHSRLSCGPETYFFMQLPSMKKLLFYRLFRFLPRAKAQLLCARRSWPDAAVDFLFSIHNSGKPVPTNYGFSKEDIFQYLRRCPPSIPAILASLTEQFMHNRGKERWVEKTPGHLIRVREIRRHFPNAPIVRIVRDPRDVALSIRNVPWGPNSFLGALIFWLKYDEVSYPFFENDPRCHTIRYEDLIYSPEGEIEKVCRFINAPFEEAMLDTTRSYADVNRVNEPWKEKVQRPFDKSRVRVWEKKLEPQDNQLAESFLGGRLRYYGYPVANHFPDYNSVLPLNAYPGYRHFISQLAANGTRLWPAQPGERPSAEVYLGDPGKDGWLSDSGYGRAMTTLQIGSRILYRRLSGRRISWVCHGTPVKRSGVCSSLLSLILPRRERRTSDLAPI